MSNRLQPPPAACRTPLVLQDNVPVSFNGSCLKGWVSKNVTNDSDRNWDIFLEAPGIVDRLFPRSVCIQVSTGILHLELQSMLMCRRLVPLIAICSRKWAVPFVTSVGQSQKSKGGSSRGERSACGQNRKSWLRQPCVSISDDRTPQIQLKNLLQRHARWHRWIL
jgi:hypothetical protein